jgi:hypothetical protein
VRTLLLTAGRLPVALDLARKFKAAGHRVLVADPFKLHGCRFSAAVDASFMVPSPRENPHAFVEALVSIAYRHRVDLLIPVFEDTLYIAQYRDRFPSHCEIFASSFDLLHGLHHKWHFHQLLGRLGLEAPRTLLIEDSRQLRELDFADTYALKACYSRASLKMYELKQSDPLPEIDPSPKAPWIAQEWIRGEKFCSYTVCRNGRVLAHATYPVIFGVRDRWCVCFQAVDHPEIYEWVRRMAAQINYTGQMGFDFVQTPDGRLIAIECNPRPTSGVHLFEHEDRLDRAFHGTLETPLFPRVGIQRQIALGFLAFGWRSQEAREHPIRYLRALLGIKDIVFTSQDPLPWLMQPAVFIAYTIRAKQMGLTIPALITHDLEWN